MTERNDNLPAALAHYCADAGGKARCFAPGRGMTNQRRSGVAMNTSVHGDDNVSQ